MKKQRKPRLVSEIEKEVGETVEVGKEQASLGQAVSELLRQIFGGAKLVSPDRMKELKAEEDEAGRKARAEVLKPFFLEPPAKEERVYERQQREQTVKKMEARKKTEEEAKKKITEAPKGREQRGAAFALKRKKTKVERKGGKF